MNQQRAFIESNAFPVTLVSQASAREKQGGGRPDYWEMVFWWTRKPLISARAVIVGCLLPEEIEPTKFVEILGLNQKAAHRFNPSIPSEWIKYFGGKKLIDPFAGFGSIPFEAIRLGLSATAVELLPTAYVFLKAILEYPLKYGEQLIKDVQECGNYITEQLREDPLVKQLYEDEVEVYIASWEIKCPHCSKWTLLIGNHWLARVKDAKGRYRRLAWLEIVKSSSGLSTTVVDLNSKLGNLEGATVSGNKVTVNDIEFNVPKSNINSRAELADCLNCGGRIRYIDPKTKKHYLEKKKLPKEVTARLQWYVKYALTVYNSEGPTLARQTLLVKVEGENFIACDEKDQHKLEPAMQEVERFILSEDPDLPKESFAPYGHSEGGQLSIPTWGFDYFYKLFSARQLITLIKLVKLIRKAGNNIEEEKIVKGMIVKEAHAYAEAVTAYLAIALCKYAQYSSIGTGWHASFWAKMKIRDTMSFRGVSLNWNSSEANPINPDSPVSISGILRYVVGGLRYIVNAFHSPGYLKSVGENIGRVFLDDATMLSNLNIDRKFDLVVTDPPYYGDVAYAEISDFYFIWLKRALSAVKDGRLVPRFIPEAFFSSINQQSIEIGTQWEKYALREVSLNSARLGQDSTYEDGVRHFQNLLDASFLTMASILKEDGHLVTYYAHTDPEAWKALLRSGWAHAGLTVSNAFPITTELEQSVLKMGKLSLDTSIVVVWRKYASGSIQASELYEHMIQASKERVKSALEMTIHGRDLFIGALATALSEATKYKEIIEMKKLETSELMDKYVLRAALYGLVKAISHKAQVEEAVKTSEGMLYLVTKFLYSGSLKKIVTSDDARIFSLGTGVDLSHAINNLRMFRAGSEEEEGEGSSLAKRKMLILLEPQTRDRLKFKDLLDYRGLDSEAPNIRCSIDALHLLEYYALTYAKPEFLGRFNELKTRYPSEVDEAMSLARVIHGSLEDDVEKDLCSTLIEKIMPTAKSIGDYVGGS